MLLPAVSILLASFGRYFFDLKIPSEFLVTAFILGAGLLLFAKKHHGFLICLACVSFFYLRIDLEEQNQIDLKQYRKLDRQIIQVRGVVEEIPSLDWKKHFKKNRSISFLMKLENPSSEALDVYQRVFVYDDSFIQILPGDFITVVGEFRMPQKSRIPGGFDTYDYYQKNRYVGNLRVKGWDAIEINNSQWHWRRWVFRARRFFYQQIKEKYPSTSSGFVASVVIGYKDNLDAQQITQFQNLGIAHVFAISGLHLGLIALWSWWAGGLIFISLRKRTLVTLLMTFLYCLISGGSLSSIRAFMMLTCFLGGYLLNKRGYAWNNYFLSIILLFLWSPSVVLTVGFQLSYLAVASILLAHYVLVKNSTVDVFELLEPKSLLKVFRRKVFELLFYSLMISITTGLVTAYHFNIISYSSIFLNLLIIPYFTLVLGVTFFFTAFSFVIPKAIFVFPDFLIRQLFEVPDWIASWLPSYQYVQQPSILLIVILLGAFFLMNLSRMMLKKMVGMNVLFYLVIVFGLCYFESPARNELVILDVGKAQAIHVQTKQGGNFLFDCGTISGYDSISPYLKHRGVNELTGVYISHDNSDHFNCWESIFKKFKIQSLYAKPSALKNRSSFRKMRAFMGDRSSNDIRVNQVVGHRGASFKCLQPSAKLYVNKNEESVVWLADLEWCEVLFPGDIQDEGVLELVTYPLAVKSKRRIMIMPHHGRNVSHLNELLAWFDPDLILVSGDKLSTDVGAFLSKVRTPVLMTSDVGTIIINESTKLSDLRHKYQNQK